MNFPALFRPYPTVRHAPISVCDMDRFGCAAYSDFTVRHAPIYAAGFIVDFYCHRASVVIELDGSVHEEETQKENDVLRDQL